MRTIGKSDMSDPTRALGPEEAADRTFAAHGHDSDWLDALAERLDRLRGGASVARTIEVWGLSQPEAARLFGVSRQAVGKWLRQGAPSDHAGATADLSAATDLLVRHLERDRIPAAVRRPIPALGGESLMALWGRGETRRGRCWRPAATCSVSTGRTRDGGTAGGGVRCPCLVARRRPGLGPLGFRAAMKEAGAPLCPTAGQALKARAT